MSSLSIVRIAHRLEGMDWTLLKGSALISVGTALARVLGLAFSLVLAMAFSADDYGQIRYAIALASIVAIGTQPFGQHVIARFVSRQSKDPESMDRTLSNLFFVLPLIFLVTLLIAVPVLFNLSTLGVGILVVFTGETLFYAYWGLSSGFLDPRRLTTAYLGSNIVQIIATVLLIEVLGIRSPTLALSIYGLSYLLPLGLLIFYWPMPGHLRPRLIQRRVIGELLRFSVPIWISQTCYVLNVSLDLLLLERFVSAGQLGAYSLSKTLATVFIFIPTGISTLLMPKVAALPSGSHRQVLVKMLGVSLLINALGLIAYMPLVNPFTEHVFGSSYIVMAAVSILLALDSIASGTHGLVTAVFVGSGRPQIESASRIAALAVTASCAALLIPPYGILGAAITMLTGKLVSLVTYALLPLAGKVGSTSLRI